MSAPRDTSSGSRKAARSPELWLAVLVALSYLVWILSMPAWPSQDGPVHLFYTHVLGTLLAHSDSLYARFFSIKHLLPPYALYYYLLLALSRIVPLLLADRLVICAYLILFLTGFHALARAIVPTGSNGPARATLLATLLVLNWPLGMGFVNYCLSLALALWALALWFRFTGSNGLVSRIAFVALVVAVTLSHPVPLLIVLGVATLELVTRRLRKPDGRATHTRIDVLTLALAALPLLYVKSFTAAHPLAQRTPEQGSLLHRTLAHAISYAQGKSLGLVFGPHPAVLVYRLCLLLTLLLALGFGATQFLRNRRAHRFSTPDLFFLASLFLACVLPWLPSDISGAYFFPERLVILIWLFALLAAAGWAPTPSPSPTHRARALTPALLVFAVVANAALLFAANRALRPFAAQTIALQRNPLIHAGDLVLTLESEKLTPVARIVPAWNPRYWISVHSIRTNNAILANCPWLDSSIIPLAAEPALPAIHLTPDLANSPGALTSLLRTDRTFAQHLLPTTPVISFTPADLQPSTLPDPILLGDPASHWSCTKTPDGTDQICRAQPQ